jgi:hypothetical protein
MLRIGAVKVMRLCAIFAALYILPAMSLDCYWDGTYPFCMGECKSGYVECSSSMSGDGATCVTGMKKRCCIGGCGLTNQDSE